MPNLFLGHGFGGVDVDRDGKIIALEFHFLREKVAAMPHRFGLAQGSGSQSFSTWMVWVADWSILVVLR